MTKHHWTIVMACGWGLTGTGCDYLIAYLQPAPPAAATQTTSSTTSPDNSDSAKSALAQPIRSRAEGVSEIIKQAIMLHDRVESLDVVKKWSVCKSDPDDCEAGARKEKDQIGALCGVAFNLQRRVDPALASPPIAGQANQDSYVLRNEPFVTRAEKIANEALQLAKAEAEGRKSSDRTRSEEISSVNEAKTACKTIESCGSKCEGAVPATCVAAWLLWKNTSGSDFSKPLHWLNRACDMKFGVACEELTKVQQLQETTQNNINTAWDELAFVADDLARKKYQARWATQNSPGAQTSRAVGRMQTHMTAITRDDFCPKKKAFLSGAVVGAGPAEFSRRATAHCKDNAPTMGLGGTEATLTSDCNTVFATPCPLPPSES